MSSQEETVCPSIYIFTKVFVPDIILVVSKDQFACSVSNSQAFVIFFFSYCLMCIKQNQKYDSKNYFLVNHMPLSEFVIISLILFSCHKLHQYVQRQTTVRPFSTVK